MASSEILSNYSASRHYITLTFKSSIQVSTLSTDDFTFETIEATPQVVPFKSINLEDDYDSIRRQLVLYFAELPPYSGDYNLTISGLRTASGYNYATETLVVPYSFDNAPFDEPEAPDNFIEVEDHSIRTDVFDSGYLTDGLGFYVKSSNPELGEIFVEKDFERGRITITFSSRPSSNFITTQYFKVQRKEIGYMARWERLNVQLTMDSYYPRVYIYVPSNDATPVYNEAGKTYFEDGYKYRVRVSGEVSA